MEKNLKSHWNRTYRKIPEEKLGWYEENPEPSLRLINKCNLSKDSYLLNVGAGASTLTDKLLKQKYENIIVNDLSSAAMDNLKERIGKESDKIMWIADDLTHPSILNNIEPIDLWHDRAVLHFFNNKDEQDEYFRLLKKLVKPDGFVIIAAFNLKGATKCSGLPIHRYDKNMLQEKLGKDFKLIEAFDYTYRMPSGDTREYIYTLFKRKNKDNT